MPKSWNQRPCSKTRIPWLTWCHATQQHSYRLPSLSTSEPGCSTFLRLRRQPCKMRIGLTCTTARERSCFWTLCAPSPYHWELCILASSLTKNRISINITMMKSLSWLASTTSCLESSIPSLVTLWDSDWCSTSLNFTKKTAPSLFLHLLLWLSQPASEDATTFFWAGTPTFLWQMIISFTRMLLFSSFVM